MVGALPGLFNVGLITGFAVTRAPGRPAPTLVRAIGERGHAGCGYGLSKNHTNLPHVMSRPAVSGSRAALGAFLGTTFVMAVGVDDYTLHPYPTAGGFVEGRVGSTDRSSCGRASERSRSRIAIRAGSWCHPFRRFAW